MPRKKMSEAERKRRTKERADRRKAEKEKERDRQRREAEFQARPAVWEVKLKISKHAMRDIGSHLMMRKVCGGSFGGFCDLVLLGLYQAWAKGENELDLKK